MIFLIIIVTNAFILFFWPCHMAHGILVPRPEIELSPSASETWSLNHWPPGKCPTLPLFALKQEHGAILVSVEVIILIKVALAPTCLLYHLSQI